MRDEVKSGKPVTETIEQYRREHPGALERAEAEILAEEAANAEIIPFVQSTKATFDAVLMRAKWANILDGDEYEDRLAGASADIRACLAEIERLGAFEKRILAFRDGLRVDSIDEDGTRYPYMLCGNDADVLEGLEKAING